MTGNDFVKFFLRTPLRIFMGDTMLITVKGCRTGKEYSTPVGYYREGDCLWVISNRDRTWWRNVRGGADVTLLMKGKTVRAHASTVVDACEVEKQLAEYIRHIPMSAKAIGIRVEGGNANVEDISRVSKDKLFVRLKLTSA